MRDSVIIERDFKAPIERVFEALINPEDLTKWHHAGDGWQTPYAQVDPVVGGKIKIAYADPGGNVVFDFEAVISEIVAPKRLAFYLQIEELIQDDSRLVTYDLSETAEGTHMRLEFDIEHLNSRELQEQGWSQHYDNLRTVLEGGPHD